MIQDFPTCSSFVHLVPRSVFQFQAFCQPTWQELHGPEHEETRGRRRNLVRFQVLQGFRAGWESLQYWSVLVPQFLSGGLFESLKVQHWSFSSGV